MAASPRSQGPTSRCGDKGDAACFGGVRASARSSSVTRCLQSAQGAGCAIPHGEVGAGNLEDSLRRSLRSDLQSVLRQNMAELRAELKAELQTEILTRWGDPLDDHSSFRRGLRAELQVQLRIAAMDSISGEAVQQLTFPSDEYSMTETPEGSQKAARYGVAEQQREQQEEPWLDEPPEGVINSIEIWESQGSAMRGRVKSLHPNGFVDDLRRQANGLSFKRGGGLTNLRHAFANIVHKSFVFDAIMGAVIVANTICVGLEIQWSLDGASARVEVTRSLEHVFLVVFVVELCIRIFADGTKVRRNKWFLFDALLVAIGISSAWIIDPIVESHGNGASQRDEGLSVFSQVLILRVLRLLRLIRALRLIEHFQELWKLTSGLMSSIRTVFSAWLLVMITVYIFACLGVELVTQNEELQKDPICSDIVETHFRTLPLTMLTLVQFANADSIASIYTPLVTEVWYLAIYFGVVWLVVTISLMNLVTGVIVDQAISQGSVDRDMDTFVKRKMLRDLAPAIQSVFRVLDKNGDGVLHLSEVRAGLQEISDADLGFELPQELRDIIEPQRLSDLFEFLDADASGDVDEAEFLDGVFFLALQTVPIETAQILHLMRSQIQEMQVMKELAFSQACEKGCASLAKGHKSGDFVLNCELEGGRVKVASGGLSEERTLPPHPFTMTLCAPLQRDYPARTAVSRV